jgi:hypothetical protein
MRLVGESFSPSGTAAAFHVDIALGFADLPLRLEISRTDAARSNLAAFSQRRSALIVA